MGLDMFIDFHTCICGYYMNDWYLDNGGVGNGYFSLHGF